MVWQYLDIAIPLSALTKPEMEMTAARVRKNFPQIQFATTSKLLTVFCLVVKKGYADMKILVYRPRDYQGNLF